MVLYKPPEETAQAGTSPTYKDGESETTEESTLRPPFPETAIQSPRLVKGVVENLVRDFIQDQMTLINTLQYHGTWQ